MGRDTVLVDAGRLGRAGDPKGALRLLCEALRRSTLGPEAICSAGRLISKLQGTGEGKADQKVLILGQSTTTWLVNAVTAMSWRNGVAARVSEGDYDNVLQVLAGLDPSNAPDFLVLLPWTQRLFGRDEATVEDRIAREVAFWQQAWSLATKSGIGRLIQVGYDWIGPGALGYHLASGKSGEIALVRGTNSALRDALPSGSYFVPLEEVSGTSGRRNFYDSRRYHWTKQPFSEAGLVELARHIVAGMHSLTTGPRKVLVLDLDDTLWGGLVGESGPHGIALSGPEGEAFKSFQMHLKGLARRGVLLAVCSKNNTDDARSPFEKNSDMILRLDDFAHFVANWEPKTDNLKEIAKDLRLGLDSLVFFDDSPSERELVRQCLPQIEVVDVPQDPAGYIAALEQGLWFETCDLTDEDRQRTTRYVAERRRLEEEATVGTVEDYLASLAMKARVRPIDEPDMQRVVQLLSRTNQFNLTTRRHNAADVRHLLARPGSIGLTLRLEDRFSEHGLVAVAIAVPLSPTDPRSLRIDTFLMSCRVIGRKVENVLMDSLLNRATELRYTRVVGEFLPTEKNDVVSDLYERLGFSRVDAGGSGDRSYELPLPTIRQSKAPVETID